MVLLPQEVGGQAVLGRQDASPTPWLTERHGYDPTSAILLFTFKTSILASYLTSFKAFDN